MTKPGMSQNLTAVLRAGDELEQSGLMFLVIAIDKESKAEGANSIRYHVESPNDWFTLAVLCTMGMKYYLQEAGLYDRAGFKRAMATMTKFAIHETGNVLRDLNQEKN